MKPLVVARGQRQREAGATSDGNPQNAAFKNSPQLFELDTREQRSSQAFSCELKPGHWVLLVGQKDHYSLLQARSYL